MPVVLHVTFRQPTTTDDESDPAAAAAKTAVQQRAHKIANNVPGLIWKIWIAQPANGILGGTYLFASQAAAEAYLASPIPDDIRHLPEFTFQIYEVQAEFSAITHAPLQRPSSLSSSASS